MFFICFLLFVIDIEKSLAASQKLKVNYLVPGEVIHYVPDEKRRGFYESDIRIYCYEGSQKKITNYFQTINLQIEIENIDDFAQYEGGTPEIVKEHHDQQKSLFSFNFFTYKKTKMTLDPFNQTCMGIETLQPYQIRLNLVRVDIWKFGIFCFALIVFSYAAILSKNALFYYLAGVAVGICASFIILMYLAGKLIPRRSMMIGAIAGGSTLAIYILRLLWDNFQVILVSYSDYVFGYVLITGLISFIICYRFGPPKNKRSKDLIEWCLQIICLGLIYFTSYYTKASIVIIISLIILYYFPRKWIRNLRMIYQKWFPPRRRYLTLEEFKQQGIVETKKALTELRDYCSSPECKQWKVMTKLKNPKRFASFIEGEAHLMDEEIFDHDSAKFETDSDESENNMEKPKISDDEIEENEDISDDEELFIPTKLRYRGASTSRAYSQDGSRNNSYNRNNSNYVQENLSSSKKFSATASPYSGKIISPIMKNESPYNARRKALNNARLTPNNFNNSKIYYSSFKEYSDEES